MAAPAEHPPGSPTEAHYATVKEAAAHAGGFLKGAPCEDRHAATSP
ncbi:hypothetical protein ACU686_03460 [Yinghuangia aomiensis]